LCQDSFFLFNVRTTPVYFANSEKSGPLPLFFAFQNARSFRLQGSRLFASAHRTFTASSCPRRLSFRADDTSAH